MFRTPQLQKNYLDLKNQNKNNFILSLMHLFLILLRIETMSNKYEGKESTDAVTSALQHGETR